MTLSLWALYIQTNYMWHCIALKTNSQTFKDCIICINYPTHLPYLQYRYQLLYHKKLTLLYNLFVWKRSIPLLSGITRYPWLALSGLKSMGSFSRRSTSLKINLWNSWSLVSSSDVKQALDWRRSMEAVTSPDLVYTGNIGICKINQNHLHISKVIYLFVKILIYRN